MSSSSSADQLSAWKERTKFTITTNGTPFGQYRGIVFLSQLDASMKKVWTEKSLNESADDIIIGTVNGQTYRPIKAVTVPRNDDSVIFIQNDMPHCQQNNVNQIEPDYNYGHYD